MSGWWDRVALRLTDKVRDDERVQMDRGKSYDDDAVRVAIVHAREDIVLVASYLSSLNRQIATLKVIALVIAVAAVYIALRLSH